LIGLLAEEAIFAFYFVKFLFECFGDDVANLHGHSPDKGAGGNKKKGEGG